MKHSLPFLVVIAFFIIIAVVIIAWYNYKLKKQILAGGPLDSLSYKFFSSLSNFQHESLKWGVILLFGGAGLVLLEFIPFDPEESSLPYGIELIFVAAGFLVYYFFVRRERARSEEK